MHLNYFNGHFSQKKKQFNVIESDMLSTPCSVFMRVLAIKNLNMEPKKKKI